MIKVRVFQIGHLLMCKEKEILRMNEEEKNKTKELLKAWKREAKKIKDNISQPKKGYRLDNGNSGQYTKLTQKYQKLIEERIGRKIWSK